MRAFISSYKLLSGVLDDFNWGNKFNFVPFYKLALFVALGYVYFENWFKERLRR